MTSIAPSTLATPSSTSSMPSMNDMVKSVGADRMSAIITNTAIIQSMTANGSGVAAPTDLSGTFAELAGQSLLYQLSNAGNAGVVRAYHGSITGQHVNTTA